MCEGNNTHTPILRLALPAALSHTHAYTHTNTPPQPPAQELFNGLELGKQISHTFSPIFQKS